MISTDRKHLVTTLARLVVVPLLCIAACTGVKQLNFTEPGPFAQNLFRIATEGTAAEWGTQLTSTRRKMGTPYVTKHFESWRTLLQQLQEAFGKPISAVEFRVNDNALEFFQDNKWNLLFRVAVEDGALRINQD